MRAPLGERILRMRATVGASSAASIGDVIF
jgi:hypothetical protein